jgi:hypothetical protein
MVLQQHGQYIKWLPLEFDSHSALAEFAGDEVRLKRSKSDNPGPLGRFVCHGHCFLAGKVYHRALQGEDLGPPEAPPIIVSSIDYKSRNILGRIH